MTLTLIGRWQTRILLFTTVGVVMTLPFFMGLASQQSGWIFFIILAYILLLGLGWDIFYIYLQKFRWDRDWPGIFQFLAALWEGIFFVALVNMINLPGIPPHDFDEGTFILHYSLVWTAIYITSQGVLRILFPHWRFRGGRWLD